MAHLNHRGHSNLYQVCEGHSELIATNALVPHSIHKMGYIFSFRTIWGSPQSISFDVDHCI